MQRIKIRPYKLGSNGARKLRKALAEVLGKRILMTKNNRWLKGRTVINWGSPNPIEYKKFLGNLTDSVRTCINKFNTFQKIGDQSIIPEWTRDKNVAKEWAKTDKVYCRRLLSSFEGRGIVVASSPEEVVDAPLYTKRFRHSREYRVHVAFDKVIQVVQKRKRSGNVDANPLVRSNSGWVFARTLQVDPNSEEVTKVKEVAMKAAKALDLHFGAFDVLYSQKQNRAIILECNTAPGLDDTSAKIYAQAFKENL